MSDKVCHVAAEPDPVAAVLEAHRRGRPIALATSGTSGSPRAVLRTTQSWVSSFATVTALLEMTPGSRVWVPGPISASMNLFAAVHAADLGAVVVPDLTGATHAHLTPAALSRVCVDRPADLDGVHVLVAGDALGKPLAGLAGAAGALVSHYYGAAELSFVAWGSHDGDLRRFREVEVEVRDGVIWVRSPYVCSGYVGTPGPLRLDAGWATVGDRGALTDGFLRVLGRGTESVTTAAVTVRTAEVEDVLRQAAHGEVYVVGVPHPDLGQVLAVVLTEAGDRDRVRSTSRDELTTGHRPRLWFHVPRPPLTAAAKVDRVALSRSLISPGDGVVRLT